MYTDQITGREKELAKLHRLYGRLPEHGFQVCFITGEAGTGKTVLLNRFIGIVEANDGDVIITGSSCPVLADSGGEYYPFRDILQSIVKEVGKAEEFKRTGKEKWKRVFGQSADLLLKVAPDLLETFVPMGTLVNTIGGKVLEESGIQRRVGQLKEGRTMLSDLAKIADQYVEMLKMIAQNYRLVFYIDNLQWIDRQSADLLHRLNGALKNLPVLFIGGFRSTDIDYFPGRERHPLEAFITRMKVDYGDVFVNLDGRHVEERRQFTESLLEQELKNCSLAFRDEMFKKTGGNPLFIVELLNSLKENGSIVENQEGWTEKCGVNWDVWPVRIDGIVREKVAGLEERKLEILSVACVQGYGFSVQVLSKMVDMSENELLDCLSGELEKQRHLVFEGKCYRLGGLMVSRFYFSDCFFREFLYQGLGASKRMILHSRIAFALEELYPGNKDDLCFELASHYENAGEYAKALSYVKKCVVRAMREADYCAAKKWAEKGECLLAKTEVKNESGSVLLFYLQIQMECIRILNGIGASDLPGLYERSCRVAAEEANGENSLFWEGWWLCLGEKGLSGALKMAEREAGIPGEVAVGICSYWMGDFERSRELLGKSFVALEPDEQGEYYAWCSLYYLLSLFHLAEYEEIEKVSAKVVRWVEETGQVYYRAIVVLSRMWLAFLDGDMKELESRGRDLKSLLENHRLQDIQNMQCLFDTVCLGQAQVWNALNLLKQMKSESGTLPGNSLIDLMICRICLGKHLNAALAKELKNVIQQTGDERCYLAEIYLLAGRCYEGTEQREKAEECRRKASGIMEESGEKRFLFIE